MGSLPPVSLGLLTAIVGVYALDEFSDSPAWRRYSNRYLVLRDSKLRRGEYWSVAGHMFRHASFPHIAFNALTLASFGPLVGFLGSRRSLGLFLGGGALGGVAECLYRRWLRTTSADVPARYNPKLRGDAAIVGASGGLLSWFGYSAALMPRGTVSLMFIPMPNYVALALLGGGSLYAAYAAPSATDDFAHVGHLGGLAVGVAAALVTRGRYRSHMH